MKILTLLFSILLLIGCDGNKSVAELCRENPEICQEFGQDSWCKRERIDVAVSRIKLKSINEDPQKYNLLIAYENYVECMGLASQIQHIKLKEKTTMRKNNLLKAEAKLAELSQQTLDSPHPYLLYFHWSRDLNKRSLAQFLKLEGSPALENSLSQFQLATYYVKKDNNKTLRLLFHSLELHQPGQKLIPEVFETLTTMFTNRDKPKQAYIWLKIYSSITQKHSEQVQQKLTQYQTAYGLDGEFLDEVASNTLSKIEDGKFKAPKF